jgi:ABC-2 type transport system ATP-binding protein
MAPDFPDIQVLGLGKHFGPIRAVDDISFEVRRGEVLGFLGPNGAGKSTTMKMLTCFLAPSFGTARVGGYDIVNAGDAVRSRIGYLPENAPLYEDMRVGDFLDFIASVRRIPCKDKRRAIDAVSERVAIEEVRSQPIATLSKGFKRRVGLAQALLHDPSILILDEPTDGLDPNQKFDVRGLIREMAATKVILLSTHILEEVDEVCSRSIIISRGKIVADGTPASLRRESPSYNAVHLVLAPEAAREAKTVFERMERVSGVETRLQREGAEQLDIFPVDGAPLVERVIDVCRERRWAIRSVSVDPGNLAEVFRKITETGGAR